MSSTLPQAAAASKADNARIACGIIVRKALESGIMDDVRAGKTRALVICGATGTGKSEVAELVAAELDADIVSADSMQVYRGMDIGTAKMPAEKRGCPYHCIDIVDPGDVYSAALYQDDAREAIDGIVSRGRLPIVCGGTGLYIRAAVDDMRFPKGDQTGNPVRTYYEEYAEEHGSQALYELLVVRDPRSAELIHPNNVRRVVRAFEMLEEGENYADQAAGMKEFSPFIDSLHFGLTMETSNLYPAIDARVDRMMEQGLLDEVADLVARGYRDAMTSMQAIGYKEFLDIVCEGDAGDRVHDAGYGQRLADAVDSVKRSTRRYSKRQRTWFRRDPRIEWLWMDAEDGHLERSER